jgi:hypothetical protein
MKRGRANDPFTDPWFYVLVAGCVLLSFLATECEHASLAHAQDTPATAPAPLTVPDVQLPVTGEILALDAGDRAPHAGMLILDDDLVAWRQTIERLAYRLGATIAMDAQTLSLRLDQEHARTTACEERVSLRDELWRARATELGAALATSQAHANDRGFWESPLLWTIVGAVLGGAVVGLIAGALR